MLSLIALPVLAQSGFAEVPVRANLACDFPQVLPQLRGRGSAPEPVSIIYLIHNKPWFEYQRVGDHGIMVRVGVLLYVEVLLHFAPRIRQERPVRPDGI